MSRAFPRCRAALIATVCAGLTFAVAAPAHAGWSQPVRVSPPGENADLTDAAVSADGSTYVGWTRSDGTSRRVQVAKIAASGSVGAIRDISPPARDGRLDQLVTGPDGTVTVLWDQDNPPGSAPGDAPWSVYATRLTNGGAPTDVRLVAGGFNAPPRAAAAARADGAIDVVFRGTAFSRAPEWFGAIGLVTLPVAGPGEAPRLVWSPSSIDSPYNSTRPTISREPGGSGIIAWVHSRSPGDSAADAASGQSIVAQLDAASQVVRTVFMTPGRIREEIGSDPPKAIALPGGAGLVAWTVASVESDTNGYSVGSDGSAMQGIAPDGSLAPVQQVVSAAGLYQAETLWLGIGQSGAPVTVSYNSSNGNPSTEQVLWRAVGGDGMPGPSRLIGSDAISFKPAVDSGLHRKTTVAWQSGKSSGGISATIVEDDGRASEPTTVGQLSNDDMSPDGTLYGGAGLGTDPVVLPVAGVDGRSAVLWRQAERDKSRTLRISRYVPDAIVARTPAVRKLRVTSGLKRRGSRRVRVTVANPNRQAVAVRVTVRTRGRRPQLLARTLRRASVRAGGKRVATLTLTAAGRRLLAQRKRVAVAVTVHSANAARAKSGVRRLTLRH